MQDWSKLPIECWRLTLHECFITFTPLFPYHQSQPSAQPQYSKSIMAGEGSSIRSNRSSISRSIKRSVASRQEHARSIRRVSVVIQEGGENHPPEKFTFVLGDPINNEDTSLGRFRNTCGKFVNNYWVQVAMTALIVLNAILLGALTFSKCLQNI